MWFSSSFSSHKVREQISLREIENQSSKLVIGIDN